LQTIDERFRRFRNNRDNSNGRRRGYRGCNRSCGRGPALRDERRVEERARLIKRDAERGVFDEGGANDLRKWCRKIGERELTGRFAHRQGFG